MLHVVSFFLFLVVCFFVFFLLNRIIVKGLSYDLDERFLHFRFVIAGFFLAVIAANSFVSPYLIILVDKIINFPVIKTFVDMIIPARTYELIYLLLCMLGMNIIYTFLFILEIISVRLGFLRKKNFVEYDSLEGVERILRFPWYFVNLFYKKENGKVMLTQTGYSLGTWIKYMKLASIILWVAEYVVLYIAILWGRGPFVNVMVIIAKAAFLVPMSAFLVIEQMQLFLEGPEEAEAPTFGTVKIREKMVGNLNALIVDYVNEFSEQDILLYAECGDGDLPELQGLQGNDLGNQQLLDCKEEEVLRVIANQLRNAGIHQNFNFQNAVIELLNGNAVFVRDFFDGEFTIYLCAYLNHYICQGKSAVFFCESEEKVGEVIQAIERNNGILKGMNETWTIRRVKDISPNMVSIGVLVCTYDEFLNLEMSAQYKRAYEDLFCAVFTDSMECMINDSVYLKMIFGRLASLAGLERYVFISSDDNESMRGLISTYLPKNSTLVRYKNDMRKKNTGIMVWKEESICYPQNVLEMGEKGAPYLGTALPLAFVAVKNDFPKVHIIPGSHRPNADYDKAIYQNNLIGKYLKKTIDYKSVIRNSVFEAIEPQDLKVIIVYDEEYNLFSALWKWFKYAGSDQTLVHVVSPSYMLREFFVANFSSEDSNLLYENNKYQMLYPKDVALRNTQLATLLASVCDCEISVDEIMDISRKYGWEYRDIREVLKYAIGTIRSIQEVHKVHEHFVFNMYKSFETNPMRVVEEQRARLSDQSIVSELKEKIARAKISYGNTNQVYGLRILKDNILNYYLDGQMIVYNGSSYRIGSIDRESGIIHATPKETTMLYDYHMISDFEMSDAKVIDCCVDSPLIDYNLCSAKVTRNIRGYISSINGNDFTKAGLDTIADLSSKSLRISNSEVPVLEIRLLRKNIEDALGQTEENTEGFLNLLCVLLNGTFKTLFPETYQNIIAVLNWTTDEKKISDILAGVQTASTDDLIYMSIPRMKTENDSVSDEYVKIYIVEFSCIEYGMVRTVYEAREKILRLICEYLEWYLFTNEAKNELPDGETEKQLHRMKNVFERRNKGTYLNYGGERISSNFAPNSVLLFLNDVLHRVESDRKVSESNVLAFDYSMIEKQRVTCSFCNRRMAFAWRLSDNRFMCSHCHDHQMTQKDEINKLFIETQSKLEEFYFIKFRKDISVRFQTAEAIKKVAGDGYNGRVVGFYRNDKHDLWIESKGPKVAMRSTIIHELTHSWQYDNLNLKELVKVFGRSEGEKKLKLLLEGHAVFVELEAMSELGDKEYVKRMREDYERRNDIYGEGYLMIRQYINTKKEMGNHITSFEAMKMLVDSLIKKEEELEWPKDL